MVCDLDLQWRECLDMIYHSDISKIKKKYWGLAFFSKLMVGISAWSSLRSEVTDFLRLPTGSHSIIFIMSSDVVTNRVVPWLYPSCDLDESMTWSLKSSSVSKTGCRHHWDRLELTAMGYVRNLSSK